MARTGPGDLGKIILRLEARGWGAPAPGQPSRHA